MKRRHEKLTGTLTLRLSSALRRRLAAEANRRKLTPSEVVRETLTQALVTLEHEARTLGERTANSIGVLSSTKVGSGREANRALRTWNPNRRG
jgi:hypothetical protein